MKKVAIIIAFALCACFANAQIYLGTVDGYIFYMNNSLAVGANVSALVVGCSGGGCSGNTLSQSNGYYVIANLNLASGGTVKVNATKSPAYGNSSGIANEFDAARVNVTLCIAPSSPALIDQTNTHDTNVTLYWTSGTDPLSLSTYDQYQLDSGTITTQTSPKTETNLSYQTHTWRVRTCNTNGATGCCSAWSSDSFQVYNNAPSVPILVDQGNTHDTNVTLYWTSGTDSDGDPTYDQFQMDSGAIINTTSPKYEENLSYQTHTWKVRTCDVLGACSNWAQDSFDVQNSYPSAPVLEDQYPTNQSYVIVNWTSGTDPDGDPVRDEFQFSTDYNFSTLFYNSTNASHPLNVSGLTTLTIYYWRVRSCDNTGCSSWSTDVFFTYPECPPSNVTIIVGGGGGGGGGRLCQPDWRCGEWSKCTGGVTYRDCYDWNKCYKPPQLVTSCKVDVEEVGEVEKKIEPVYLGDVSAGDIISKEAPLDRKWIFTFKDKNYTISIVGLSGNSIEFFITDPARFSLKKYESAAVDVNNDGVDDFLFVLEDFDGEHATISMIRIVVKEGGIIESPLSYVYVREKWNWLWFLIIIFEFIVILYFYYKTKNIKKKCK